MAYKGKIKLKVKMSVSPTDVMAIKRMGDALARSRESGPDGDGVFRLEGIEDGSMLWMIELMAETVDTALKKLKGMNDAFNDFYTFAMEESNNDEHKDSDDD